MGEIKAIAKMALALGHGGATKGTTEATLTLSSLLGLQASRKFFPITFFGSITWIAVFSYLMVWWAHQVRLHATQMPCLSLVLVVERLISVFDFLKQL